MLLLSMGVHDSLENPDMQNFHVGNTGSNPVGDAKVFKGLAVSKLRLPQLFPNIHGWIAVDACGRRVVPHVRSDVRTPHVPFHTRCPAERVAVEAAGAGSARAGQPRDGQASEQSGRGGAIRRA